MQQATSAATTATGTPVIYKGETPVTKINSDYAIWQNGEKFYLCSKDDRTSAREIPLNELKELFGKPYHFIFWRAKNVLTYLKSRGLPIPEYIECAYTANMLSTKGAVRFLSFDKAYDYAWQEGLPQDDLHRAYALWWMWSADELKSDGIEVLYRHEINRIREKLSALNTKS